MSKSFDVVVVGAGPAGYVAAIRCTQLGLKTACVDEWINKNHKPALGGTCLNVGCIPSKALLDSSEQFHKAQSQFPAHGIRIDQLSMDVGVMISRKDKIVHALTSGIDQLFKANNVERIHGHGTVLPQNKIAVSDPQTREQSDTIEAANIILASGSEPTPLAAAPVDGARIVDSAGALEFDTVPARIGVIGAGVIGLELGSVWRRLGAETVLLEALETFLPMVDQDIAKQAARQFHRQGLDIRLGALVESTSIQGDGVVVRYRHKDGVQELEVDRLIVAIGRRPYTKDLAVPETGLKLDDRGFVEVNDRCQSNLPGVYAVGDAVRGPMLAHKGSEEGVAVAESIAGGHGHVNYDTIPWVIYTAPEIAWVGHTEHELKDRGEPYAVGTFPFAATGRARAMEEPVGLVKILAHSQTDRILGVHILGPHASELIAEGVLAMEYAASAEDLARTIHAHPTLSEAIHEAALAVSKRAVHKAN